MCDNQEPVRALLLLVAHRTSATFARLFTSFMKISGIRVKPFSVTIFSLSSPLDRVCPPLDNKSPAILGDMTICRQQRRKPLGRSTRSDAPAPGPWSLEIGAWSFSGAWMLVLGTFPHSQSNLQRCRSMEPGEGCREIPPIQN
jgi:hypothetical protein